jgi:triphosphoribosyl-dephospho-CoA synthase
MSDAHKISQQLAQAFIAACEDELMSPKPGNVHVFSAGHGMEADHFVTSAQAAAAPLTALGVSVGERILNAVEATWARVGLNTNLGILLLCAPIAHAVLQQQGPDLRVRLSRTLDALDRNDADLAFRAILRAAPAGLGAAPQHDVAAPPEVGLIQAMQVAAHRDRIAFQYANGFEDVFETGLRTLAANTQNHDKPMTTLRVYLSFLSAFRDSHIARKFGEEAGDQVLSEARAFQRFVGEEHDQKAIFAAALQWDRSLKDRGLNPGTSADLTVATLFADYASRILANGSKND